MRSCPALHRRRKRLAKLYTLQHACRKRETLSKYKLIGCIDELMRPRLSLSAKVLIYFVNLDLFKQLSEKANWLSGEFQRETFSSATDEIATCNYYLGKLHYALNRFPEAECCFTQALRVLRTTQVSSQRLAKVLLRLGKIYEKTGRVPEAEILYSSDSVLPATSSMHTRLGDLHFAQHSYEASEAEYDLAMSLLRESHARLEHCAEVALRQALLYSRARHYRKLHAAVMQADTILRSVLSSQKVDRLKLTLKLLRRTIPEETFYDIESSIYQTTNDLHLLCTHLISFAEDHESGARAILLKALADVRLFARDSEDRGHLALCFAEQHLKMGAQHDAWTWFLHAFDVMFKLPQAASYLPRILLKLTSICDLVPDSGSLTARIGATLKRFQSDASVRAEILFAASCDCMEKSRFQAYESSVLLRGVYEIRKQFPSDVERLETAFDNLKQAYACMEAFDEEESLLLEHLARQPGSGKCWLQLCHFYETHKRHAKQEDALRRAVAQLRGAVNSGFVLLALLTKWGKLNLRLKKANEAEDCFREAAAVAIRRAEDIEKETVFSLLLGPEGDTGLKSVVTYYTDRKRHSEVEGFLLELVANARNSRLEHLLAAGLKLLGDVYVELQLYGKAEDCFRETASIAPCDNSTIRLLIQAAMYRGKEHDPEIADMKTLLGLDPQSTERWVKSAAIHTRYRRHTAAWKSLESGLVSLNDTSDVRESQACWLPELLAEISKHCEHDPALLRTWLRLAPNVSEPPESEKCGVIWRDGYHLTAVRPGFQSQPKMPSPEYWKKPGQCWMTVEQQWLAFVAAQQHTSQSMGARAFWQLAKFYVKQAQYDEAESAFQAAVHKFKCIHPTYICTRKAIQKLARFYVRRNQVAKADAVLSEFFETLMSADPGHARTGHLALEMAELRRLQRRYCDAESLIKSAVEAETDHSFLRYFPPAGEKLVALYVEMGRKAEAEKSSLRHLFWLRKHTWGNTIKARLFRVLINMGTFCGAEVAIVRSEKDWCVLHSFLRFFLSRHTF